MIVQFEEKNDRYVYKTNKAWAIIGFWEGNTNLEATFATQEEAQEYLNWLEVKASIPETHANATRTNFILFKRADYEQEPEKERATTEGAYIPSVEIQQSTEQSESGNNKAESRDSGNPLFSSIRRVQKAI